MRILIEKIKDTEGRVVARHYFHTDDTFSIAHPSEDGKTVTPVEYIALLASDSALREKAGWHKMTQNSTETRDITLWQKLLDHTASPDGDARLKALALKSEDINDERILG